MKRLGARFFLPIFGILLFIAIRAWAGGEGIDVPEALEQEVSLDGLSGLQLYFAELYNNNLLLFALICTALMAAVGMFIAYATDIALKMMGLEVNKISHEE